MERNEMKRTEHVYKVPSIADITGQGLRIYCM
jgi:hypothetical protein